MSGRNFDHRKQWLVVRIKELAANFAIDVCAYAVMSNHYHLVLHVNQDQLGQWSDEEVIKRWTAIFPNNAKLVETLHLNRKSKAAQKQLRARLDEWRSRLGDISWFMRCLNESLARRANREDDCTGRFWEGRFKSQALLDEKALVTCMAYVDLNPIRAGISDSLKIVTYFHPGTPNRTGQESEKSQLSTTQNAYAPSSEAFVGKTEREPAIGLVLYE